MSLGIVTGPAGEPLSLADAKMHLRVTAADEDAYIAALIAAARGWCEDYTGLVLAEQTLCWRLDALPVCRDASLILPTAPVQSVDSIAYVSMDGTEEIWDPELYMLDPDPKRPRIKPVYGESWPANVRAQMNAVTVTFRAGFTDDGASPPAPGGNAPAPILHAIRLVTGHFYEHRMDASRDQLHEVPLAARTLLGRYKIRGF